MAFNQTVCDPNGERAALDGLLEQIKKETHPICAGKKKHDPHHGQYGSVDATCPFCLDHRSKLRAKLEHETIPWLIDQSTAQLMAIHFGCDSTIFKEMARELPRMRQCDEP